MLRSRLAAAVISLRARPWIREAEWTLATGVVALLVAVVTFQLWWANPHTPIVPEGGDYLVNLALVKAMMAHGWYWHVPELGAPFGLNMYDFSPVFSDYLHFGLMKTFSIVSQDPILVFNAFMIAGFPLAAMTAFAVQRDLGVTRAAALVTSVAFSALPYHFLAIGWTHTAYYAVPLVAWLVIVVILGRPVWTMHGRIPLPTLKVAIAVFIVSGASVYWTAFCFVLLVIGAPVVALVRLSWQPLLRGAAVAGMVGILAVAAQAPSIIYHARDGSNKSVGVRQPFESEIYGLKLADLLIPSQHHPLSFLANAGKRYDTTTTIPAEGPSMAWLGTLGSIGLLLGIGALFRFGLREPRVLPAAGFVSLTALLVSWTGGVSSLIAWFVTPHVRAWDRMCVVIGFTALLSIGLGLDRIGRRLKPEAKRWRRIAIGGGLAVLLVLAVIDQTPKGLRSEAFYKAQTAVWRSQQQFTAEVVYRLPRRDASVLQLPYVPFPEAGPQLNMPDYEHLRPYVQTFAPVKWSGGAMKGRPTDWGPEMANWSTHGLVIRAAAARFDGIWLDRRAYADQGAALTAELSAVLGGQAPLNSDDGRISYFDLQPLEREQAARYTRAELRVLGDEFVRPRRSSGAPGLAASSRTQRLNGTGSAPTAHSRSTIPPASRGKSSCEQSLTAQSAPLRPQCPSSPLWGAAERYRLPPPVHRSSSIAEYLRAIRSSSSSRPARRFPSTRAIPDRTYTFAS